MIGLGVFQVITLALVALGAVGGALGYKSWRDAHEPNASMPYPEGVSYDLADRPLRQAWDSLEPDEQVELARLPVEEIRDSLSLIAWLVDLGSDVAAADLAVTDYGMAYG